MPLRLAHGIRKSEIDKFGGRGVKTVPG